VAARRWILGLLWEVLCGLFRVAVALGVFLAANSKFETIVFALLLLILNDVSGLFSWKGASFVGLTALLHGEPQRIRRLLKDEPPAEVQESDDSDERELQKIRKRVMVYGYIRGTFTFITWVIIIVNLLFAIF
jgi:hypothetical protein